MAYRYGLIAITLTGSSVAAMIPGTVFLAKRWRRARVGGLKLAYGDTFRIWVFETKAV